MRTLIVQTSFLGDMVLTTPLIAHAARDSEVDVLTTPASAGLLRNSPDIRRVFVYDKRGSDRGIAGFWKTAMILRRERHDRALMAQGSVRSGALAMAAGIPVRTGFDTSSGRRFYTERVPYIENDHHAKRLLRLAAAPDSAAMRPRLFPGADERSAVDRLLTGHDTARMVALAPGSVWATKRWPGFGELAAHLSARYTLVVVGAAADADLAHEIASRSSGAVIDATGRLSLLESAELIGRCLLLATNDSAPLHLASAMNTPTVAIFGPTVPEFGFGPLAERASTVGLDALACRPCDRHGPKACPLGHWRCMREVTAAAVAAESERVIGARI